MDALLCFGVALCCHLSWYQYPDVLIVPTVWFWWLWKPGEWPESVHRLRKLMVRGMHWLWALAVLEDVRKVPGTLIYTITKYVSLVLWIAGNLHGQSLSSSSCDQSWWHQSAWGSIEHVWVLAGLIEFPTVIVWSVPQCYWRLGASLGRAML